MEVFNLTSAEVTIVDENGKLVVTYPSRGHATCEIVMKKLRVIDGVPISRKQYTPVIGLPEASVDADKYYIVDEDVAEALKDSRFDILIPIEPFVDSNKHKGMKVFKGLQRL